MRKETIKGVVGFLLLAFVLGLAPYAFAGPGTVIIQTDPKEGITARFGGQVRMIPTFEEDWDLGLNKIGLNGLRGHINEAGTIARTYVRTEDRLYFNFAKGDLWDVYMALEFDSLLTQRRGDRVAAETGTFDDFGVERIQASLKLAPIRSRLHAGWDVYHVDVDAGGFVYTDDDPGIWLTGGIGPLSWRAGFHQKNDQNFRKALVAPQTLPEIERGDEERRIWSARADYTIVKGTKASLFWVFNDAHVRGQPPAAAADAIDVNNHFVGAIISADIAGFKPLIEVAGSVGDVKIPTAAGTDIFGQTIGGKKFDFRSVGVFGDVAYDASKFVGFRFEPHVGFYWLRGDDDPTDDNLEGWAPTVAMPRFTPRFGGENTILADGLPVWGSPLYSFLPEMAYGNQNFRLSNGGGLFGISRGDNPGMTLVGGGIDTEPIKGKLRYRTNAYGLWFNEDFLVGRIPAGAAASLNGVTPNQSTALADQRLVDDRFFGTAWDNEITYFFTKNTFVKLQFSFLFPGEAADRVTGALANLPPDGAGTLGGITFPRAGKFETDTIKRVAVELWWNF
ncbi:MAG: hypothetical protein ACK4Z6_02070 [Candidatus Methylomirabilales bacterium]